MKCAYCNKEMIPGRKDKRFCDADCRSAFNYHQDDIVSSLRSEITRLQEENDQLKRKLKEADIKSRAAPTERIQTIEYYPCPICCVLLEKNKYLPAQIFLDTRKTINCPKCESSITFDGQTKHYWPARR